MINNNPLKNCNVRFTTVLFRPEYDKIEATSEIKQFKETKTWISSSVLIYGVL